MPSPSHTAQDESTCDPAPFTLRRGHNPSSLFPTCQRSVSHLHTLPEASGAALDASPAGAGSPPILDGRWCLPAAQPVPGQHLAALQPHSQHFLFANRERLTPLQAQPLLSHPHQPDKLHGDITVGQALPAECSDPVQWLAVTQSQDSSDLVTAWNAGSCILSTSPDTDTLSPVLTPQHWLFFGISENGFLFAMPSKETI